MSDPATSSDRPMGNSDAHALPLPQLAEPVVEPVRADSQGKMLEPLEVKLPGQPRVAAGWRIPGASAIKIRKWMKSVAWSLPSNLNVALWTMDNCAKKVCRCVIAR